MKDIPRHNLKTLLDDQSIDRTKEDLSIYSTQYIMEEIIPAQRRMIDKAKEDNLVNLLMLRKLELSNMERVLEERIQQEGIELPPPKKQTATGKKEQEPLQLIDLFKEPSLFIKVIDILAANGYCDRNTKAWIDNRGGAKGEFAALIKELHKKGFLKQSPNSRQIAEIASNTFYYKISDSIVRKRDNEPPTHIKNLIPPASTLI